MNKNIINIVMNQKQPVARKYQFVLKSAFVRSIISHDEIMLSGQVGSFTAS